MSMQNQLLMLVHDAVWDSAYATAGVETGGQRLLNHLLGELDEGSGTPVARGSARKPAKTASELRAIVAQRTRPRT